MEDGGGLGGGLGGRLGEGLQKGLQKGLQRGLQNRTWRGLVVKLRSCLVQVWFRLQHKFNSLELDS